MTPSRRRPDARTDPSGCGSAPGFAWKLDPDVPYIATAIHAGTRVRRELAPYVALASSARRGEEDLGTDVMIRGLSSAVWGLDSRAVYDLNRPRHRAIPVRPEWFWGQRVYGHAPPERMILRSRARYDRFYRFLEKRARGVVERFGFCVIYDFHSYNLERQARQGVFDPPVFNVGTALMDRRRWRGPIEAWLRALRTVALPGGRMATVSENRIFEGRGEFCRRLTCLDDRILVLPTEIAKVYMDEQTGEMRMPMLEAMAAGLRQAVFRHSRVCRTWPSDAHA